MSNRLLIHIGYHKTATTWMQRSLFAAPHGYAQICGHAEVDALVVRPHGLHFDPVPMRQLIDAALSGLTPGTVPVISSEILSGNPSFGGRGSDIYAERLRKIAPEARILISTRTQLKLLPSLYMTYLGGGGTMTPAQFFAGTEAPEFIGFEPAHFEYDRLIGLYRSLFGAAQVFVLPQESLVRDPDAILDRLAAFCGNEGFTSLSAQAREAQAASYPEHAAPLLRRLNHFRRSLFNPNPVLNLGNQTLYRSAGYAMKTRPAMAFLGRRKPVSAHVRQRFAGRYSDSNRRLKDMLGAQADLSGYD